MDLNKAVVAYKGIRKSFEAFLVIGEALEGISSLQNYKVEAEIAAKKIGEAVNRDSLALQEIRDEGEDEKKNSFTIRTVALQTKNKAKADAELTVKEAKDKASHLVAEAEAWISIAKHETANRIEEAKKELSNLDADKSKLVKQVEELNQEFMNLKKRLG